jgi:5-formyltetrahydrofolate cyclo-ligase
VSKNDIRQDILNKRLSIPQDKVIEISSIIQDRILRSPFWPKTGRIALYYPIKNEVMTQTIFQKALEQGLKVFFPRVEKGINFYEVNGPDDLQKGSYGISEPKISCPELQAEENLDLFIVPGIAFTQKCYRIGYGKGFYDSFITDNDIKTPTIGLSYEFQIIEAFPVSDWDQPLQGIMTDKNFYSQDAQS